MGITYTEVFSDSSYDGWSDIRQARDVSLKVAKPLLDAGWVIHLDAFKNYSSYTSTSNAYGLVLISPDNLFSIGFRATRTTSGYYNFYTYLYSRFNTPSTVDDITTKEHIQSDFSGTLGQHPTNGKVCTNAGLVELRDGGFLMHLSSEPFTITDGVDRTCFGVLPVLHCSSGATINTVFVFKIAYNAQLTGQYMIYYTDSQYGSEVITTTYDLYEGGVNANFEIIVPAISAKGTFIIKSLYRGTKNNPTIVTGQTILLDNKPYIVLSSGTRGRFLLAI